MAKRISKEVSSQEPKGSQVREVSPWQPVITGGGDQKVFRGMRRYISRHPLGAFPIAEIHQG